MRIYGAKLVISAGGLIRGSDKVLHPQTIEAHGRSLLLKAGKVELGRGGRGTESRKAKRVEIITDGAIRWLFDKDAANNKAEDGRKRRCIFLGLVSGWRERQYLI